MQLGGVQPGQGMQGRDIWNWFSKPSKPGEAPAPNRVTGGVRVLVDSAVISIDRANQPRETLEWDDIASVMVVTNDAGPSRPDLFWVLQAQDRRPASVVPMGSEGEQDLLRAMQARLKGFDNMAVVEAMSSTENAGFIVWQADGAAGH